MRWPDVEEEMSAVLGVGLEVRTASRPLSVADLSPGERAQLPEGRRGHDWLLGRAALKQLLDGADTCRLSFPHRCLSLTHAAGVAVAARCRDAVPGLRGPNAVAGVGVDYEGWRTVDPRAVRFFLQDHERHGADLLRMWTVKEALFKATPHNDRAVFLDYAVADPTPLAGMAADGAGRTFRYASGRLPHGWLTVAVCDAPV